MLTLVAQLAAIPIVLLGELWRGLVRWRRVDLLTKNRIRAGLGAAMIVLAVALWTHRFAAMMPPIGGYVLAGGAAFGLLWLVVGLLGAQGARFDFMSFFWWGVGLVGCVALLVFKDFIQWPS